MNVTLTKEEKDAVGNAIYTKINKIHDVIYLAQKLCPNFKGEELKKEVEILNGMLEKLDL